MTEDSSRTGSEAASDESGSELPQDRTFGLLSTSRRREAIDLLREHDHVGLPDIAEAVTVRQLGKEITEISPEQVKDTYMMLYHSDIPKLVDENVIVYDQEQDVVATGENFSAVEELLSRSTDK
ncbi:hypothetical protein ACFQH2_11220 [Natronoarchaeum sp. GCM10025703]|uniref:DUF7344 domain-containing protein n=1 Tax=unclassified Natronoarchaeum TaxID=2620183 RepID=UPI0036071D78